MPDDCIFCRIASKQIPANVAYEDDELLAFHDIEPQAPVHVVIIPKRHYPTLFDMQDPQVLGRLMLAIQEVARRTGVDASGFRALVNYGEDGGQYVPHVHFHLLGGRLLGWPPG